MISGELIIFAGSDDGHFYAVNSNGDMIFDFQTDDKIRTASAFASTTNGLAIFTASYDGKLYALNSNGNLRDGWPVDTGISIIIDPIITDLDGDNLPEIITGNANGLLVAYHMDGSVVDGFPLQSGFGFSGSILSNTNIGKNSLIQSGAVIGDKGFVILESTK